MLETERLVLRPWCGEDREPFAALNADPRVMEHFPETLTRESSDAMVHRMDAAWREHGFAVLGLAEIVSFTTTANLRSQAVMQRIGMQRDASRDFEHPSLEPGHPLRPHVLHALGREGWAATR